MKKQMMYAAALAGCPGIGAVRLRALLTAFPSAEQIWKAQGEEIKEKCGIGGKALASLMDWRTRISPEEEEEKRQRAGVRCVLWTDDAYPVLLRKTYNPPAILFYRGHLPETDRTIAFVGARNSTPYGQRAAFRLAEELAKAGVTVVSGGARGIDTASHKGALRGGGRTIMAAAFGLDRVYPPENRELFERIEDSGGALISEYPLGTPPLGRQFPARNRIIAGMSRGTLVIEAARRSGSLITADFALEEGRDVFALPGSIWSPVSEGTHHLIRNGAILVSSGEDILSEYGWERKSEKAGEEAAGQELTAEEEVVFKFCSTGQIISEEELADESGFSAVRLKILLLKLQMKGYIAETSRGLYQAIR
jgi:DNA processing protein